MSVGKKKGETLLETIVGIFMAAITITFLVTIQSVQYKSRNMDKDILQGVYRLESVKKLILCNLTYDEIKDNFNNNTRYLNTNTLENELIMESDILSLIEWSKGRNPSIEIWVNAGEGGTFIINIKYTFENGYYITNVFYKGNYEKVEI